MSYGEMDGVKRIRTKGGSDLVKHQYKKPPLWGTAAPWELYQGSPSDQNLSPIGRRSWDLTFSYLQGSDDFHMISSLFPYESTSATTGLPYSSGQDALFYGEQVYDSDTFYSQVIHKTNGGQLPFIFQPDKNNNSSDGFAIAKFDQNSFKFSQQSSNLYRVSLKIREVW